MEDEINLDVNPEDFEREDCKSCGCHKDLYNMPEGSCSLCVLTLGKLCNGFVKRTSQNRRKEKSK